MSVFSSEDVFLGYKQEYFDYAEKLLLEHGGYTVTCLRELKSFAKGRLNLSECNKILQRVWSNVQVKQLEKENAELRQWCIDLLGMAVKNNPDWDRWPEIYEELRKLKINI